MQKVLHNIADVSLIFLAVFGGLHISASFLIAQDVIDPVDTLLFNVLDLPFLFAALVYGSARFSLALETLTGNLKVPFIICTSLAGVVFLGALFFNFGLPDAKLF